jgi:hypothetical protein
MNGLPWLKTNPFIRTTTMTVSHYINEHDSDIRAIKPGWYAVESNGKLSSSGGFLCSTPIDGADELVRVIRNG